MFVPASWLNDALRLRLVDLSIPMSELELRKIIRECERLNAAGQGPFAEIFETLGLAHMRLRQFGKAVPYFRNAIHHRPSSVGYSNLGAALHECGKHDEAMAAWEAALKHAGAHAAPLLLLNTAEGLHSCGRHDEAVERFAAAVRAADLSLPWHAFAVARMAATIGAEVEAIEFFARFLALSTEAKLGNTDALAFIVSAPAELKVCLENAPELQAVIDRGIGFGHLSAPHDGDAGSDEDALAMYEEWADLREAASAAAMSGG